MVSSTFWLSLLALSVIHEASEAVMTPMRAMPATIRKAVIRRMSLRGRRNGRATEARSKRFLRAHLARFCAR